MLLQCLMLGVKIGKLNKDNHYGSMSPFPTDFTVFGSCPEQSSVLENIYRWHYSFFKGKSQDILRFFFSEVIIYFNVVLVLFSNCFMMNLKLQNAEQRRCLCACCMYMMQTTTTNFKAFRWYFQKTTNDWSLFFLLRSKWTNTCNCLIWRTAGELVQTPGKPKK